MLLKQLYLLCKKFPRIFYSLFSRPSDKPLNTTACPSHSSQPHISATLILSSSASSPISPFSFSSPPFFLCSERPVFFYEHCSASLTAFCPPHLFLFLISFLSPPPLPPNLPLSSVLVPRVFYKITASPQINNCMSVTQVIVRE